jgi:ABC-type dipeptide/oligopeptide/nickel transport system ATPase component
MDINPVQKILDDFKEIKINRDVLTIQLKKAQKDIRVLKLTNDDVIKARWVMSEVQLLTQKRFKDKFENLITLAIQSIWDRPLRFCLEFEQKRNQMQCNILLKETVNGVERVYADLENEMGGSMLDVISFMARIILWSLERPRSRNVIILDEPMKNMGELILFGGQIIREISHKLKFQLIIITHDKELIDIADKAWQVTHDGNKSHLKLFKDGDAYRDECEEVQKNVC